MAPAVVFDVFLSYNRPDEGVARNLKAELELMGLQVFLDVVNLRPGIPWGSELEQALERAPAVAVLVGPNDIGATQELEVRKALELQVSLKREGKAFPVIPVILPGARPSTRVTFVNQNTWINLTDFTNTSELDRLYFGITGRQRLTPPGDRVRAATSSGSLIEDVVKNLVPRLPEGGVCFFLGGGVSRPPSQHELAMALVDDVRQGNPGVPDIPTLDVAGSCYSVDRGEELAAEDSIRALLSRHAEPLVPRLHERVATLAQMLTSIVSRDEAAGRGAATMPDLRRLDRDNAQPLVLVCTTYDLAMERALLREGVSFTRLVQNHAKGNVDVCEYEVSRNGDTLTLAGRGREGQILQRVVGRDSREELDNAIEKYGLRPERGARASRRPSKGSIAPSEAGAASNVLLYKPLGSRDVTGSCFISTDHHLELILQTLKVGGIPDQITEKVRNNRLVFLGYGFFDGILRLLQHTLLRNRTQMIPAYVVKTSPSLEEQGFDARLEAALWNDVKVAWPRKGVTLVEATEEAFMDALVRQFAARFGHHV